MDIQYIRTLPVPACAVDPDGIISGANPLIKNVFVYDDIVGKNFFTMTGFKRDQLMQANSEEMILERNGKVFKLWINEGAREDEDLVVFFDEAVLRIARLRGFFSSPVTLSIFTPASSGSIMIRPQYSQTISFLPKRMSD